MTEKIKAKSVIFQNFENEFTKRVIVPTLQRPYVWEAKKHVKKFIDDIKENKKGYFIGSIVLVGSGSTVGRDEIIDGQQRLTTISLIIIALRDIIKDGKQEGKYEMILREIDALLRFVDSFDREEVIRLKFTDQQTNSFYQEMVKNNILRPKTETQKRLLDNYNYIKIELLDHLQSGKNIKKEKLENIWSKIKNLNTIGILCEDHTIAYELFESINATGLSLASIDLIKNFIFKQLKNQKNKLKQAEKNWLEMESIFIDNRNLLKTFLRHQWISYGDYVSHSALFEKVNKKYKGRDDEIIKYTKNILEDAEYYYALRNYNIDLLNKFAKLKEFDRNEIKNVLRFLSFLKVDQVYASILYFYRENDGKKFIKYLNRLVAFQFLYKYIPGSPSAAERIYAKFADKKIDKNKNFQDLMKLVDNQSEIFQEKFLEKIKYVEGKSGDLQFILEQYVYSKPGSPKAYDKPTVEHIINQKYKNVKNKKILDQLGNLTIFERDDNASLPDNINEKLLEYKNSAYPEHLEIVENYDFLNKYEESINKRGRDMAKKIYEIFMDILRTGKLK